MLPSFFHFLHFLLTSLEMMREGLTKNLFQSETGSIPQVVTVISFNDISLGFRFILILLSIQIDSFFIYLDWDSFPWRIQYIFQPISCIKTFKANGLILFYCLLYDLFLCSILNCIYINSNVKLNVIVLVKSYTTDYFIVVRFSLISLLFNQTLFF